MTMNQCSLLTERNTNKPSTKAHDLNGYVKNEENREMNWWEQRMNANAALLMGKTMFCSSITIAIIMTMLGIGGGLSAFAYTYMACVTVFQRIIPWKKIPMEFDSIKMKKWRRVSPMTSFSFFISFFLILSFFLCHRTILFLRFNSCAFCNGTLVLYAEATAALTYT